MPSHLKQILSASSYFEQFKNKHVRVVIEAEEVVKSNSAHRLSALQLDTTSFKFDRNEANER